MFSNIKCDTGGFKPFSFPLAFFQTSAELAMQICGRRPSSALNTNPTATPKGCMLSITGPDRFCNHLHSDLIPQAALRVGSQGNLVHRIQRSPARSKGQFWDASFQELWVTSHQGWGGVRKLRCASGFGRPHGGGALRVDAQVATAGGVRDAGHAEPSGSGMGLQREKRLSCSVAPFFPLFLWLPH